MLIQMGVSPEALIQRLRVGSEAAEEDGRGEDVFLMTLAAEMLCVMMRLVDAQKPVTFSSAPPSDIGHYGP